MKSAVPVVTMRPTLGRCVDCHCICHRLGRQAQALDVLGDRRGYQLVFRSDERSLNQSDEQGDTNPFLSAFFFGTPLVVF